MRFLLGLTFFGAIVLVGCKEGSSHSTTSTPSEVSEGKMPPLLKEVEARYQPAAAKVAAMLRARGEDPAEFYAVVTEERSGSTLVFSLTHKNTYLPENSRVLGNPTGKDRRVEYDVRSASVTRTLFYQ